MNDVFDAYAAYYDLLYRDKNYAGEAEYVDRLIRRYASNARNVLELGCGTGTHARELVKRGYSVTGIDLSESMIAQAIRLIPDTARHALCFASGDLRTFRSEQSFDVVLALFHVMSYQTTNEDLGAAMATAAMHLRPGGLLVFDCWYGPGVLTDPPAIRVRRVHAEGIEVIRIAEPVHHVNLNCVDVHYEIVVEHAGRSERINETHAMRYLFAPEVDALLQDAGLTRVTVEKWMEGSEPDLRTWNACFVARR